MLKLNIQMFAEDGKVIIGTEIDDSGFEKGIQKVENKKIKSKLIEVDDSELESVIQSIEEKINKLKAKAKVEKPFIGGEIITVDPNLTKQEEQYMERLIETRDELLKRQNEIDMANWQETIKRKEQLSLEQQKTAELQKQETISNQQIGQEESKKAKIVSMSAQLEEMVNNYNLMQKQDIISEQDEIEAENLKQAIIDLVKQIEKLTGKKIKIKGITDTKKDFSEVKKAIEGIGQSMNNAITKVGKMALAVFGIRTAYNAVRSAASTLSQYDDQLAINIEWIRYLLASTLKPVVEYIVNLVYKLLTFVGRLAKTWFGINLFANASAKQFEKVHKNINKSNKKAKELRKTLAGFDEMTILQKNDEALDKVGGGGDYTPPNFGSMKDVELPKWLKKVGDLLKWVYKNWEDFIGILSLVGFAIGVLTKNPGLALISLITFLVTQVPRLIDNVKMLTGSNSLLEAGLKTLLYFMLPITGPILVLADAYTDLTTKTGSTTKATNNLKEAQKKLRLAQLDLTDSIDVYKNALETAKEAQKNLEKAEKETKLSGEELYKKVQEGKLSYLDMNEAQKKVYEAYVKNKEAQKNLKTATDDLKNSEEAQKKALKDVETATLEDALAKQRAKGDYEGYKKSVIDAYNSGKISAGQARDYIEQACQDMTDANSKTFTKDLPSDIKEGLNPDKYKNAWSKFKAKWNEFFNGLKTKLEISGILKGTSSGAVKSGFAKGGVVYHKLPKLAPGGIINQPGRGVPIASAIGGERGAEGVIPLTDAQQMALLGEAIGRYITVNANIVNTMNGRVISRELQKVQNESDFAFNR